MPGVVWSHWSPVNVDADEVVDGGAEEDDHEAGHGVAHLPAQPPPAHRARVTCHVLQAVTCHVSRVTCHEVSHLPARSHLHTRRVLKGMTMPQPRSVQASDTIIRLNLCK